MINLCSFLRLVEHQIMIIFSLLFGMLLDSVKVTAVITFAVIHKFQQKNKTNRVFQKKERQIKKSILFILQYRKYHKSIVYYRR